MSGLAILIATGLANAVVPVPDVPRVGGGLAAFCVQIGYRLDRVEPNHVTCSGATKAGRNYLPKRPLAVVQRRVFDFAMAPISGGTLVQGRVSIEAVDRRRFRVELPDDDPDVLELQAALDAFAAAVKPARP